MTDSYILYLETDLSLDSVLQELFEPKTIAPIEGTNLIYARGTVYLAHAQELTNHQNDSFGFSPTVSIRYFPDGVSSVKTAMDILAQAIIRFLHQNEDNLLLSANNKIAVITRFNQEISVMAQHNFWGQDRLRMLNLPYAEV